jgi:hypothetical protein
MCVAPGSLMMEIADYSLQWLMHLLLYYMHSGDFVFLNEMYPIVEKMLEDLKPGGANFDRRSFHVWVQGGWNDCVDCPLISQDVRI